MHSLDSVTGFHDNQPRLGLLWLDLSGGGIGPCATGSDKLRQVRKEATVRRLSWVLRDRLVSPPERSGHSRPSCLTTLRKTTERHPA